MKIAPIKNKKFGGVVTNVKLKNISEVECSEIKESFLELDFLLFPRQFLTDEENIHFGERFGTLEFGAQSFANQKKNEDGTYGEILGHNIQKMRTNLGNEHWHTDSTYTENTPQFTMLYSIKTPEKGKGNTLFASQYASYANLSEEYQKKIKGLRAVFSADGSISKTVIKYGMLAYYTNWNCMMLMVMFLRRRRGTRRRRIFYFATNINVFCG